MRFLGIEIRWIPKPVMPPRPLTHEEILFRACDALTAAWQAHEAARAKGEPKLKPWIIWPDKEVVIASSDGSLHVVHPYTTD